VTKLLIPYYAARVLCTLAADVVYGLHELWIERKAMAR
jgi:hypothetical protein